MQKIAVCDDSPQDVAAVVGQALPLAHGLLAANPHGVGIVDNPVANSICQKRVRQLLLPSRDVKLGDFQSKSKCAFVGKVKWRTGLHPVRRI